MGYNFSININSQIEHQTAFELKRTTYYFSSQNTYYFLPFSLKT